MPELPEVETVVRDLRPGLTGQKILDITTGEKKLRRPWKPAWNSFVLNNKIESVQRRGKWILIHLQNQTTLLVHLGMTGQLTLNDRITPVADHTHLLFTLSGPQDLRFRDVRRFGSADVFSKPADLKQFLDERLGPEPNNLPAEYFAKAVTASARCLKAILLDQSIVAGVGNIYADESSFLAGLHPNRKGQSLTPAECERLRLAVREVITNAINGRGSTIRDYIGGSGLMGTYQNEFRVYGRTGEPCPQCSCLIERIVLAGRSSHYCPQCQPLTPGRRPRRE